MPIPANTDIGTRANAVKFSETFLNSCFDHQLI